MRDSHLGDDVTGEFSNVNQLQEKAVTIAGKKRLTFPNILLFKQILYDTKTFFHLRLIFFLH
ncbi:MAG: hypothetical protein ACFFKA_03725 [Candidatus Thorarchaeota archaeon]